MSVINKAKSAQKWVILGHANNLIRFAFTMLIASQVNPIVVGVFAVANSVIIFGNLFRDFGINQGIIRKKTVSDDEVSTLWLTTLVMGVVITSVLYFSKGVVGNYFDNNGVTIALSILMFDLFLRTIYQVPDALIRRNLDFKYFTIVDFLAITLSGGGAIILLFKGFDDYVLPLRQLGMSLVTCFLIYKLSDFKPKFVFKYRLLKEHVIFGVPLLGIAIIAYFRNQIDIITVAKVIGVNELGIYHMSLTLLSASTLQIVESISRVNYAAFNKLNKEDETVFFVSNESKILMIIILSLAGVHIFSNLLFEYILNEQWNSIQDSLVYLFPFIICKSFFIFNSYIIRSHGLAKKEFLSNLTYLIIFLFCFTVAKYNFAHLNLKILYLIIFGGMFSSWLYSVYIINNYVFCNKKLMCAKQIVTVILSLCICFVW